VDPALVRFEAARRDPALAVLEGFHALKHALRFGAEVVEAVTPQPDALSRLAADLAPDVAAAIDEVAAEVPPDRFARLAPHPPPTPVVAIAVRPTVDAGAALRRPGRAVLLDHPNHLGNVGAVIRVAAAAGAAAVLTIGDRDPWHPAALRGSAGLHFAVPVAAVTAVPETDRPLAALDPGGERLAPGVLADTALLMAGSERHGLSARLLAAAATRVAIPMQPGVSSLNLATAVAVALYS
jgi:TrmH family RNA methyltransferase